MANAAIGALPSNLIARLISRKLQDLRIVSAMIRNSAQGWVAIGPPNHACVGVSSVDQGPGGIVVNFDFTASLVLGGTCCVDEYFAANDQLVIGPSIGFDKAIIQIGRPGVGLVDPASLSTSGNLFFLGLFL